MTDPTITNAAQALLDAWDSPRRWSNPGFQRVQEAERALRDALAVPVVEETSGRPAKDAANELLHEILGYDPCETACTHVLAPGWTALGAANVLGRRVVLAADQPNGDRLALTNADVANLGKDGRCTGCRRGHYSMPGGTVTNYPCTTEGCGCTHCHPRADQPTEVADDG